MLCLHLLCRWLAFFALIYTDVLWILVNKSLLTQWFFYCSCECIAAIAIAIFICWLCSAYCTSTWEISPSWQSSLRVLACPFVVYVFFCHNGSRFLLMQICADLSVSLLWLSCLHTMKFDNLCCLCLYLSNPDPKVIMLTYTIFYEV